jgi:acylphosphatase
LSEKGTGESMNKCVKISFENSYPIGFLQSFVQKHARDLGREGIAQVMAQEMRTIVLVCGGKEDVDAFVDLLHEGTKEAKLNEILVEPFLKVKDYRGVFRVIE